MKRSTWLWAGLLALTAFAVGPAEAQVARMSLDGLASVATTVVHGRAAETRPVWSPDGKRIYTEITLEVEDRLKGTGANTAVITIPGGQIGNVRYEVSDMPAIEEGEEVVVFLWRDPSGRNLVVGGAQGKMLIEVAPDASEKFVLLPSGEARMELRQVARRIKEIGHR